MTTEEIKQTFAEIRELRDKARDKESQLIHQLAEESVLSDAEAILLPLGSSGWGGPDNGSFLEAMIMAAVSRNG